MSYNLIITEAEQKIMLKTIEESLDIKLKEKHFDKIYNKIIKFYSKKIKKELKEEHITFNKLFKRNYVLNIVINYGELNHNPASLIDFKYFKRAKLFEHKKKLIKILKEYIK